LLTRLNYTEMMHIYTQVTSRNYAKLSTTFAIKPDDFLYNYSCS
jgi:hypothetical protein